MTSGKIKAHFGVQVLVQEQNGRISRFNVGHNSGHVVGDRVQIESGQLTRSPRDNALSRQTHFGNKVIAANLDYVGLVVSCKPKTPLYFIDQVTVSCRASQIEPFIVVTKLDLPKSTEFLKSVKSTYSKSVPVLVGFEELQKFLTKQARFILVGVSGAGKSSLMNKLAPDAEQKIQALSEKKSTGKHTTSGSMLVDLPGGGELIDSPGVRNFRPADFDLKDLAYYFPGFEDFRDKPCEFRNCQHLKEPSCVIRKQTKPADYERFLGLRSNLLK
ncbi:MAG: ribosome small subunit-dependent GTPase A [Deltaproteobacteria bacterium]|nr:ribosome small subunit-dependent GTPase A [Deltaproteobacteria bacterium]